MKQVFHRILQFLVISKSKFDNLRKFRWIFPSAFLSFGLLFLYVQKADSQKQMSQIDLKIEILQDHRKKLKMQIEKEQINATRLQSHNRTSTEGRRAWAEIDAKKKKMEEIDAKIQELQLQKEQLIKEPNA